MQNKNIEVLLSNYGKETYEYLIDILLEQKVLSEDDLEAAAAVIVEEESLE